MSVHFQEAAEIIARAASANSLAQTRLAGVQERKVTAEEAKTRAEVAKMNAEEAKIKAETEQQRILNIATLLRTRKELLDSHVPIEWVDESLPLPPPANP